MPINRRNPRIAIFTPATAGSLGDQAMVEVVRKTISEAHDGEPVFMYGGKGQPVPAAVQYRHQRFFRKDLKPLQWLQQEWYSRAFSDIAIIGADVIDGTYDEPYILKILNLAKRAASRGVTASVLGASISDSPKKAVMEKFREAPNVRFNARDPISKERFESHTGRSARLVADLAFLLSPAVTTQAAKEAEAWIKAQKSMMHFVLAGNISDVTMKSAPGDPLASLSAIYREWLVENAQRALVLFAHDTRPFPYGDLKYLSGVYELLREEFHGRVFLIETSVNAWEIKALLGLVDGLITGRMHAAIAALGMGTPPLCIVYNGKFEGMMEHFGLPGLCVPPDAALDGRGFAAKLRAYEKQTPELRKQALARLPAVIELSKRNFDWLSRDRK